MPRAWRPCSAASRRRRAATMRCLPRRCGCSTTSIPPTSLRPVTEVVERRDAVRLGPQADRATARDVRVLDLDVRLAVERDLDALARELDAQRVPGVLR